MKKALILFISLMLLLVGCSMESTPTTGEIRVTINNGSSRSITEGVSPETDISKLRISVENYYSSGTPWYYDSRELDFSTGSLASSFAVPGGTYQVHLEAFDSSNARILSKTSDPITVSPGSTESYKFDFTSETLTDNSICIKVRTFDHVNDTLRVKLYQINTDNTSYRDNFLCQENVIVDEHTPYEFSSTFGSGKTNLKNGYYSVSFFRLDNIKGEVFLGSMPVRVINGRSDINATWIGDSFQFTPFITRMESFDASSDDPLMIFLWVRGCKITESKLVVFNEDRTTSEVGTMDDVPVPDSDGRQILSFASLALDSGNYNFALQYKIQGDTDLYTYPIGNVYVGPTKAVTINGPEKIAKQVSIDDNMNYSSYSYSIGGIESLYYDVKWFVKQGNSDFVEVYNGNSNDCLFIKPNSYESNFSLKAELYFKDTDKLAKTSDVKNISVETEYIDSVSIHRYSYNDVYYIENYSTVPIDVNFYIESAPVNENAIRIESGAMQQFNFNQYVGKQMNVKIRPIIKDIPTDSEMYKNPDVDCSFTISESNRPEFDSNISVPANGGFFTGEGDDVPVVTINSKNCTVKVSVNDKTLTTTDGITYVCQKEYLTEGNNEISVSYQGCYQGVCDSGSISYNVLYYSNGLPSIEVDQVYQAYVLGDNNVQNDVQIGYKTLMLKQGEGNKRNTYYLYDITYSMANNAPIMSMGRGEYEIEGNSISLKDVVTVAPGANGMNQSQGTVVGTIGKDEEGKAFIEINNVNYMLLNNQVKKPDNAESYEGAWQLKSIVPDNKVLNGVLGMFTKGMLPDVDNLISFDDSEGIAVNLLMEIEKDTLRGFASIDADFSAFDETVSLSEAFTPFVSVTADIEIDEKGSPVVLDTTAPLAITTTTDKSVLVAYTFRDGMIIPVPFSRTESFGAISMNGSTNGMEMSGGRKELADFAEKAITAYPALENMIAPMFSAPLGDENPIEMMGIWKAESKEFKWADGSDWCIFKNMMNIWSSVDQKYYHISRYTNNGEVAYSIGAKDYQGGNLRFSDISENNGTVSFRITICREGLPYESGTIKLTKVNTSLMDFLLRFEIFFGEWEDVGLKFASDGNLLYMDEKGDEVVVGNWCFGEKGDTIRITIKPWLLNGMWDEPDGIKISFGAELSYKDGEILILEFIENNVVTPFGIKLNIQ